MFEHLYSTTRYLVFPSWEASVTTLITAVPPPQKVRNWKRVTDAGNDTEFASIKLQAVALFLIGIDFYGIGTSDLIGQHFAISREAGALDLHCRGIVRLKSYVRTSPLLSQLRHPCLSGLSQTKPVRTP